MDRECVTGQECEGLSPAKPKTESLAWVSGRVPNEHLVYAREVLAALAQGTSRLPRDPIQAAELGKARAETEAARMEAAFLRAALVDAEQGMKALAAALEAVRAPAAAAHDANRQRTGQVGSAEQQRQEAAG